MAVPPSYVQLFVGHYTSDAEYMGRFRREAHLLATRLALREAIETQNTKVLDMDTGSFYRSYSGPPPALFFCDANHAYEAVKADLEWARRVGTSIICGDDYDPAQHQGVVRAVDEMGGPRALVDGLFVI